MENIFVEFLPPWVETGMQPAFYDKESGTCLQQTARMYDRVNMLVRMFNKLSRETKTVVEDYIEQFVELKDYVDNYFANLDVQEEINNKLDDMVEQGTLQEIVADYLNSKAVFGFDSVSDMKSATNFVDGSYAETLGYFSKNDGGNAVYKIRKMTNDDVIDEKFIIEITGDPANELVAELIHDNEINVLQMGVTVDNFSSIVNMLLINNYNVYIPRGDYTAKETITFSQHDGQIICDGNITLNTTKTLFRFLSYRNILTLNGKCTGDNQSDSILMEISGTATSNNNNIYIHDAVDFGVGIKMCPTGGKGCAYNTIRWDIIRSYKVYGILITTGDGVNFVNENWFIGGRLAGATGALSGIKTIKGASQTDPFNGNVFDHIAIDEHYDIAIDLDYATFNFFNEMRLSEGLDGNYYIKCSNTAHENTFTNKSRMYISKLLDENDNSTYRNHYNINFMDSGGYYVCTKCDAILGKIVTSKDNAMTPGRSTFTYAYNAVDNPTVPEFYVNNGTTVSMGFDSNKGDTTITLPSIFNQNAVNGFFIKITYIGNGTNLTVKDSSNRDILTPSMITTGSSNQFFKADFIGGTIWKITKLV